MKKFGKALIFPHVAVLFLLLPAGTAALVYAFIALDESDPRRIAAYVLSFYTLLVWCMRLPALIGAVRRIRSSNRHAQRWLTDARLRINVTLSANVLWNGAYGALQLGLGIYHRSFWFYSLAGYYFLLAFMRFFLVRYSLRHRPRENMARELHHYRTCGWVFLGMNLALSGMMLFMIRENRMMRHHEITTIAMAAYTFTSLTMAIINVVRYRRYQSPAFSATKSVSLASACVSMLTLEATMLTTFSGEGMTPQTQVLFLALSGGAVSVFMITMAIYMIAKSNQRLRALEVENGKP